MENTTKEKETAEISKIFLESSKQFDKQIMYVASGALSLSFAFIKDIVQLDEATHKCLLVTSWAILAVVILASVFSQYTSAKATKYKEVDDISRRWDCVTTWLNVAAMILLPVGLTIFTIFLAINI